MCFLLCSIIATHSVVTSNLRIIEYVFDVSSTKVQHLSGPTATIFILPESILHMLMTEESKRMPLMLKVAVYKTVIRHVLM